MIYSIDTVSLPIFGRHDNSVNIKNGVERPSPLSNYIILPDLINILTEEIPKSSKWAYKAGRVEAYKRNYVLPEL
jgi:hypothetical protein